MITTTEPAIHTSRKFGQNTNTLDEIPRETAPLTQELRTQSRVWLVCSELASAFHEKETTHPSRNLLLRWRLEDIDDLLSSSVHIHHHLALEDNGEVKFLENRDSIHVYDVLHATHDSIYGTARTIPMPGNYYRKVVGSKMPPEQSEPFTTEPMVGAQRLLLDSLASMEAASVLSEARWPLLRRLEVLEHRPESERWPAAEWPSDKAFADARAFIYALPMSLIPLPHLSLADDGEINFFWGQDGIHIDLGFYGPGTYSYYACGKDGEGFYENDIPIFRGLPDALLALLGS